MTSRTPAVWAILWPTAIRSARVGTTPRRTATPRGSMVISTVPDCGWGPTGIVTGAEVAAAAPGLGGIVPALSGACGLAGAAEGSPARARALTARHHGG